MNNARVDYTDAKTGKQYSAESIELTTGAIREAASIPFKLTAFFGSNQPLMRAKTELAANLRFDRALKRYQLEDARLNGEASGEPLKGKTLTFNAQGQLLADLAANVAEWNGLKLSANQLRASANSRSTTSTRPRAWKAACPSPSSICASSSPGSASNCRPCRTPAP